MTQTDTTARLSDDAIDTIVYHYCPDLPDGNADAIWEHEPQATMTMLVRSHRALAAAVEAENGRLRELISMMLPASEWMVEQFEEGHEFNEMADDAAETMEYVEGIVERARAALRTHDAAGDAS